MKMKMMKTKMKMKMDPSPILLQWWKRKRSLQWRNSWKCVNE